MTLYYLVRLIELLQAMEQHNEFSWDVTDDAIIVTVGNRPFVFSLERSKNAVT